MGWIEILRASHIAAGGTALMVFWLPLALAKGSLWHRRIGWVFVSAMGFVSASGLVLSAYRAVTIPSRGSRLAAGLLAFISVLTAAAAWKGIRVLRTKRRTGPGGHPLDLGFAAAVLVTGAAIGVAGLLLRLPLLAGFGVIGVLSGWSDLRYWRRAPRDRMHWWYEHMGDMFGTCIIALTAFLVVNAQRVGIGQFSLVAWFAPAAVLSPVLFVWRRYYKRRFTAPPAVAAPAEVAAEPLASQGAT